ncbi:aluminum activated malate transporter family protein [Perilla frutescens var. hirtella]|uniref:Aluminum activated malate transporter family protein n=1 Tax=Perilla frutescens var. hirtella TaxID=608512 RepID=A0AAD4J4I4_PERFH|nr:aluminum activated malate transporter family protein [Perilla frutescens var. hirtella]
MEIENEEKGGVMERVGGWFKKIKNGITGVGKEAKRLGKEDPRRIVHSFKVGLAITAVSLFYYLDFFFDGFGVDAMWAVMTVVVVFEFSVGATLGKGVNRAIATLLGGLLGVGAHDLASFTGEKVEVIILGLCLFLIASMTTFFRFFPKLRARYDYGLLIFILTFSLLSVSGYRDDEVLDMAQRRFTTILIGGAAAIFVCIFIRPVWAGQDLHTHTASNIHKLGTFLEVFGRVYFHEPNEDKNQASREDYKSVLNSNGVQDSLVNFAKWEPRHGKFRYRHPWDQYLKVGSLTRECAYKIDALNGYLNSDAQQTPLELKTKIQESCTKMSSECGCALSELAIGIETMSWSPCIDIHIVNAKSGATKLKALMKTGLWAEYSHTDLLTVIPAVTVAALLIDVVSCTVTIADSVGELASLSKFKKHDPKTNTQTSMDKLNTTPSLQGSHVNILVE